MYFRYWIGLHDTSKEGHFKWASGSTSSFRDWASNEPNNLGNEDCVHTGHRNSQWNDQGCNHKLAYACTVPVSGMLIYLSLIHI